MFTATCEPYVETDLRIEQDDADTDRAREVVRTYRIPPRSSRPDRIPLMQRVALLLGMVGGAALAAAAIYLFALVILAIGGPQ